MYTSPGEKFTNETTLDVSATKMSAKVADELRADVSSTAPPIELPADTAPNAATATDNSTDPRIYISRRPGGG
jgi:hypothetical protein